MVFVNSMSDLFHKSIPASYISSVFDTMESADWHIYQVLTKRSSLLQKFINGFALIDPHGDLVTRIAARIPASRRNDIIYLDATDPTQPYAYNPLRHVREDRIALAASGMMDVFKKMWPDAWGVRSTFCATCSWRSLSNPTPPSTKCCVCLPTRSSDGASASRCATKSFPHFAPSQKIAESHFRRYSTPSAIRQPSSQPFRGHSYGGKVRYALT